MPDLSAQEMAQKSFRASPNYELVLYDRLSPEMQGALRGLQDDPDFYGVLCPRRESSLGLKSACRDTALLFLTMQTPGPLPSYVHVQAGHTWREAVIQMVLDGILEIEHEGAFLSGAAAHGLFYRRAARDAVPNAIAFLSREALIYAQKLPLSSAQALSQRLYEYNHQPLTPTWKRLYSSPAAVEQRLGFQPGGPNRRLLDAHWKPISAESAKGWFSWNARHPRTAHSAGETTFKLYVSPEPAALPDAFAALLESSASLGALAFKVGKDVRGLLRPDKMVLYFCSRDALAQGAERLRRELEGCPAQGVPFTAAVTPNGLLSWGADPPRGAQTPLPHARASWRLWVTHRLARALLAARAAPSVTVEPWQFALDRLRLEGVDTETWAPHQRMWAELA